MSPVVPFDVIDQEPGDEEARDDEEDVNADEAPGDCLRIGVIKQDGDDRERAQTVDIRAVGDLVWGRYRP